MSEPATQSSESNKLDRFGGVASGLCAAHCAVCALLPAIFAEIGLEFLGGHTAEWFFTILAISLAAAAFFSFWKRHKSKLVAFFFAVGVLGLLSSRILEAGSGHHGHHDDHHAHHEKHVESEKAAHVDHHQEAGHEEAEHKDEKGNHHDEREGKHEESHSDDTLHMAGAFIGVFSGIFLLLGHFFNFRALRNCPCPETSCK